MNLEIFILNGYGQFVWPAFLFTFLSCFFLFLKTKAEFRKQEKIFSNTFEQSKVIKIQIAKQKEVITKKLSSKPVL
tara:strand:+ start:10 stop:237 length:228 start_codon:yes stop_codon:yes gene_type:complete